MSDVQGPARPRQVTTTAAMAIVFDLVLLATLFDTLGRLGTPETRQAFDQVLSSPPGDGLGVTTTQVVEILRVLVFVAGVLGAVALVFAVFVLQRHPVARLGYTVTAALLLLTVPAVGLLPLFVAAAAIPMWSRTARDWYAGRSPAPAGADPGRGRMLSEQGPPPLYGQPPYSPSPYVPQAGPAYPPPTSAPVRPAYPAPMAGYGAYAPPPYRSPDRRPLTVTFAAVLTWIGAGVTAALMLALVAILAFGGDTFVNRFEQTAARSNVTLTADQAMALGWSVAAVFLVWSVAAIVLAVLAFRRSNAARIGLVVSSAMAALLSLVSIMSGLSAITLLMSGATIVLLFTGGATQWYSRRATRSGFPPDAGPWGPPGHQPPAAYRPPAERTKPW